MLDSGVFEPVNHKSASSFEDQSCKLFRFLPDADAENNDSCHLCHEVIADKARYFQITCHKIKFISQKAKSWKDVISKKTKSKKLVDLLKNQQLRFFVASISLERWQLIQKLSSVVRFFVMFLFPGQQIVMVNMVLTIILPTVVEAPNTVILSRKLWTLLVLGNEVVWTDWGG